MVEIIQENRRPRFSDQLAAGMTNAANTAASEIPKFFGEKMLREEERKRRLEADEKIQQLIGEDIGGIPQELQKIILQERIKSQSDKNGKSAPLQIGLQTIQRMRSIGSKGNLGKTLTRGVFGGEEARDRGEYEQLGKSLISLASNIPIRNKAEFETLAGKLYDPSILDSEREGILDAMERIISQNLGSGQSIMDPRPSSQNKRPPLSAFEG